MRLNPNVPYRTRGNGALSARFGHGTGARSLAARVPEGPVYRYRQGRPLRVRDGEDLFERAWAAVRAASHRDRRTAPALVGAHRRPRAALYWRAVREWTDVELVRSELARIGARWRTDRSDRGLVGAAASIAWRGAHATFELLTYRHSTSAPGRRSVALESVRAAERRHPELFLCYDDTTRRLLIAPHTPCPILFGVRSTKREALPPVLTEIRSEPIERWMIFRTNQGSGDHLLRRRIRALGPYMSGAVLGRVAGTPSILRGGHVRFFVRDREGEALACIAFEPTKTLPAVARELRPDDAVRVWGSRGEDPVLRLEAIEVLRRPARRHPASTGRSIPAGMYFPTASARRHLAPREAGRSVADLRGSADLTSARA